MKFTCTAVFISPNVTIWEVLQTLDCAVMLSTCWSAAIKNTEFIVPTVYTFHLTTVNFKYILQLFI